MPVKLPSIPFDAPSLAAVGETFLSGSLAQNPGIPRTLTRLSHSFLIRAEGTVVGAAYGWTEQHQVQVEDETEVNSLASGFPNHMTVQFQTGRDITIDRYDLYPVPFEQAFGTMDLSNLMQQRAFSLLTYVKGPAALSFIGSNTSVVVEFQGCVMTSIGRSYRADDGRVVSVNAAARWTNMRKLT